MNADIPSHPDIRLPDYDGGSIVNLMSSLISARGGDADPYAPVAGMDERRLAGARNLILLVIDGLGHDYLLARLPGGALGRRVRRHLTSVFPPTTATAITTFLTGTAPQQHGLTGWFMHFREIGAVTAVLPFRARFGGPGLGHCGVQAAELFRHRSVFDRISTAGYMVSPRRIAYSEFNTAHSGRAHIVPFGGMGAMFQGLRRIVREDEAPKFVYAYWPELDARAHQHGIGSREVARHLADLDGAFDRFLRAVAGTDTVVVVTADHGFVDSPAQRLIRVEDHPRLRECLVTPLCGDRRVAYCYVDPFRRGQFESYVRDVLAAQAWLCPSRALLEAGWFGRGEPHPRLAERIGHYALVMRENYAISDSVSGEEPIHQLGVHSGVSEAEMHVPLIVHDALAPD